MSPLAWLDTCGRVRLSGLKAERKKGVRRAVKSTMLQFEITTWQIHTIPIATGLCNVL